MSEDQRKKLVEGVILSIQTVQNRSLTGKIGVVGHRTAGSKGLDTSSIKSDKWRVNDRPLGPDS